MTSDAQTGGTMESDHGIGVVYDREACECGRCVAWRVGRAVAFYEKVKRLAQDWRYSTEFIGAVVRHDIKALSQSGRGVQ